MNNSQLIAIRVAFHTTFLFIIAVLTSSIGCSSSGSKNKVGGKVTLESKIVAGTVVFIGANGKEYTSPIDPNGHYTIPDAPPGKYKIAIKGIGLGVPGVDPNIKLNTPKGDPNMTPLPKTAEMGVAPPQRYASPDNGLSFTVKGGQQTFNITLQN